MAAALFVPLAIVYAGTWIAPLHWFKTAVVLASLVGATITLLVWYWVISPDLIFESRFETTIGLALNATGLVIGVRSARQLDQDRTTAAAIARM
jgi:hypothetical protein